ncbi:hypothetical protein GZL_07305 [Streptomyces sp. 769]|nr:hypothetical protein GZL_07305 [Streptomyces sp. 769]
MWRRRRGRAADPSSPRNSPTGGDGHTSDAAHTADERQPVNRLDTALTAVAIAPDPGERCLDMLRQETWSAMSTATTHHPQ